jgi:hypothetical protein
MFRQLFNFGYQRTALQAFGWYLFFALVAILIGGFAGTLAVFYGFTPANDFAASMKVGEHFAPSLPILVGVILLCAKPITPLSVIVTLIAFIVAFFAGWLGAGILLAFLTTRPSRGAGNIPSTGG